MMGDIDPESVHPAIEPEPHRLEEELADLWVPPVEVGLSGVEEVQVPLSVRHLGPCRAAELRGPVVVRAVRVDEHVAVPCGGTGLRLQRLAEPWMLITGVV